MTSFTIRKSEVLVTGRFHHPAFALLKPETNLHSTVRDCLSDFCDIGGDDIRINQDTNPLSNANVTYDLRLFNGFARVSIDHSQLILFSPHTLPLEKTGELSIAFLSGVQSEIGKSAYAQYSIQINLHAELQGVDPTSHTGRYVMPTQGEPGPIIGNSVTYYLGQDQSRDHSSIVLDISREFSECIFLRLVLGYDANQLSLSELPQTIIEHCRQLLSLVGLDSEC